LHWNRPASALKRDLPIGLPVRESEGNFHAPTQKLHDIDPRFADALYVVSDARFQQPRLPLQGVLVRADELKDFPYGSIDDDIRFHFSHDISS
jgi:hypothetical protein